jgi:tetratricopeptide (TPR) repeat protein
MGCSAMTCCGLFHVTALSLSIWLLTGCSRLPGRGAEASQHGGAKTAVVARKASAAEQDVENRIRAMAHYATGLSYELNNLNELARRELLTAAHINPANEGLVIEAVQRCLRDQKPGEAVELLTKATAIPDASGALYAWLGVAYVQAGKTEPAIAANKVAVSKMPHLLAPYQNLAQIYLENDRTNEALRVLDDAARQPTNNPGFLIELAELYSRYSRSHPNHQKAVNTRIQQLLARAADLKPTSPIHLLRLADSFYASGELDKAETFYLQLLEAHSDLPSIRAKLTEIYLRSGQREKASKQLETIARDDPTNPQTHIVLGAISAEAKDHAEAAAHFERALKLAPDLEQIYFELAGLKLSLKEPQEALEVLENARARFKPGFTLEFYTGIVQSALKNYQDAYKHLVAAEILARANDPSRLNHLFYFQLGAVAERNGDFEEAERQFRKCLELAPEYAEALNYLGYMWADNDMNLEEARDLIDKAVQLEPENSAFLDSMAWALYKLNLPEEALPYQLKAIENADEPDPVLLDHLGDIHAALEQHELAREAWKKALELEPNETIEKKLNAPAADPSPDLP